MSTKPGALHGICVYTRGENILVAVPTHPTATFKPPAGYLNALNADLGVWLLERQ